MSAPGGSAGVEPGVSGKPLPRLCQEFDAVFFDLVGTLIRSKESIGEQYAAWARRFGAQTADAHQLGAAFRDAMRQAPPMAFPGVGLEAVAAAEREWWRELVRWVVGTAQLGGVLAGETFERFFSALYQHFTTAAAWEAYPDVAPALQALHLRGVTVGLITNYDTRVYAVLDALDLSDLLDSVTIPALAGAAKPDPLIFAHALQAHLLEPARCLYVGDEIVDDYTGSEGAGMVPVLLDREGKHEGKGFRRIGSLDELVTQL